MSSFAWDNFWKQKQSFHAVTRISTTFFASQIEKYYHLKPASDILDFGCGPGFVADVLASKNVSVTGLDINEFFIEECRKKFPASTFIHITTDTAENKKILNEQLKEKKFDLIIFLGVAQYLKSITEVEDIIKMLLPFLKEQGRIIVGDVIDENTSSFRDAFSLLFHFMKTGRIASCIRFAFFMLFSNYRNISKEAKLLKVPEQSIHKIAESNSLHYQKLKNLSIHPTRLSYMLEGQRAVPGY